MTLRRTLSTFVQLLSLVLAGVGCDTPEWQALADGLRPRPPSLEELDPGTFARLAVLRSTGSGIILFQHHLATIVPHRAGSLQVTVGTHVWASVHICAFLVHVPFLPPALPVLLLRRLWLPLPLAPAGVVVFLTSLATTVQRAHGPGCLGVVGSRWRMPPRESVGRQEHVSPPMCS